MWLAYVVVDHDGRVVYAALHVSDIEQTGFLARPVVRVNDAQVTVLDGHQVSAKGHKLGAVLAVKLIQARFTQLLAGCM
jgi:hypothetical protein